MYSLVPYSASNFTSAAASRFDNFTVVDITWDVEITPGGNTTNVTGTIQTIYDEMVKINPNFMAHYPPKSPIHNRTLYTRSTSTGYDPCAPSNNNITDWNCNLGSNSGVIWCSTGIIKEEIKYLRGISGKPRNGPGPSECGRVSCEWSAAIYWCNDVSYTHTLNIIKRLIHFHRATKQKLYHLLPILQRVRSTLYTNAQDMMGCEVKRFSWMIGMSLLKERNASMNRGKLRREICN